MSDRTFNRALRRVMKAISQSNPLFLNSVIRVIQSLQLLLNSVIRVI